MPRSLGTCACHARCGPCARSPAVDSLTGRSSHPTTGRANDGVDRDTQAAVMMADTFQTMQRLSAAARPNRPRLSAAARQAYERSAGGSAQLRYALVLATPGHPARDAEHARKLLRELAAPPESLAPVERAVTLVELSQLDRELGARSATMNACRPSPAAASIRTGWPRPTGACRPSSMTTLGCATSSRRHRPSSIPSPISSPT